MSDLDFIPTFMFFSRLLQDQQGLYQHMLLSQPSQESTGTVLQVCHLVWRFCRFGEKIPHCLC